ncbi:hypothetical protein M433DRAFT_165751 [Acidomyces richmondensis BFW]|nr:hypothetical protein M433DRAFT_165751 [Acidomyces richmondensis BFW]
MRDTSSTTPIYRSIKPDHDISIANLTAIRKEIASVIEEANLINSLGGIERHVEAPALIFMPASMEEVSEIMKICHRRCIPVVTFSGGTALEGHFANTRREDREVVFQSAIGYEQLNEALPPEQLSPPDPGPGAMIPIKSSAGYDLTGLFVGCERILSLATEAVLRIIVLPRTSRVAIALFPIIDEAAQCIDKAAQKGVHVAAVEFLNDMAMKCINESGATDREWLETATLFFKFIGTELGVKEESQLEAEGLCKARTIMLWGRQALKKNDDDHVWITDVAVPISRLTEMVQKTWLDIAASDSPAAVIGHVGDGNFQSAILHGADVESIFEVVVYRMVNLAIEMEGTVTGEHGVGLVKQAFDPLYLLNCNKAIRVEPPH